MEKQLRNISDAYGWAKETAQALRAGNLAAIDMHELIDEIESIASGLRRELESTLNDLIEAMLILTYTPGDIKEARRQLVHAQGQLRLLLKSTPSIQEAVAEAIDEAYQCARGYVIEDFGVSLPERCPFTLEQLIGKTRRQAEGSGKARMNISVEFMIKMSKTEDSELPNRLFVLIEHLLKLEYVRGQVGARNLRGWTITEELVDETYDAVVTDLEEDYPGVAFPRARQHSLQEILVGTSA